LLHAPLPNFIGNHFVSFAIMLFIDDPLGFKKRSVSAISSANYKTFGVTIIIIVTLLI